MRRIFASALLSSALFLPAVNGSAWANPLQIIPDAYATNQSAAAVQPPAPAVAPSADTRPRYAAAQPSLGGGFIEMLFGGPRSGNPPAYQPAMPDYQPSSDSGPGYAPSSNGDMAHQPIDPKFAKQVVEYDGGEKPGTIIIDTPNKFLFLVEDNHKALRYGIGVGKPGFTWSGVKTISAKREWPDWRPPTEMLQRRPDLPRYMAGGPDNPLGARAMYLGSTLYRIHGSNEPWTIGTNVSSGCIRMRNDDVTDLYERVKVGTKVVVM